MVQNVPHARELQLFSGQFPIRDGVQSLVCVYANVELSKLPATLQSLCMYCFGLDISKFPHLPGLKTLTVANCQELKGVSSLNQKCTSIETFVIKDNRTGQSHIVDGLRGLTISRLVLDMEYLTDVSALKDVQVKCLVLRNCVHLTDEDIATLKSIPEKVRL